MPPAEYEQIHYRQHPAQQQAGVSAEWHVPTPVAAAGLSAFTTASAAGLGSLDAAAVVEPLDPRRVARGEHAEN